MFDIVIKGSTLKEGGLPGEIGMVQFQTVKGETRLDYSVNLLPAEAKGFIDNPTDDDLIRFVREKMGQGFTMTEAQFEAELDAKIKQDAA